ncbi:MAG: hypothetical protein ACC707_01620 [Thiohalomonadales bacterium]
MAEQINFNLLLSESDVASLNPGWKPAMVSDYSNLTRSLNRLLDISALKGLVFKFKGAGAVDPTIVTSFNLASLTRVSVGVYRATYSQKILNGVDVTKDSLHHAGYVFGDNNDHAIEIISTVAGSFDIRVWQTNSTKVAYDLVGGDEVSISILLNRSSDLAQ